MKKLMIVALMVFICVVVASCKKDPGGSNVKVIPTVKISEPNEIWASDIYIKPEDITEDVGMVRIEAGTKLGDWICPITGVYTYDQIKDYLK